MDINRIISLMEERGVALPRDLVGVPPSEIAKMERFFGLSFPDSYKKYLLSFGRSAGNLSMWMAIYFDDLKEIKEQFDALKPTTGIIPILPNKALLISNWESVFDYLLCDGKTDPEVYRIDLHGENGAFCEKYALSFSDYLEGLVNSADAIDLLAPQEAVSIDKNEIIANYISERMMGFNS